MVNSLRLMAIVSITLLSELAFAQNATDSGAPGRSEDQMIAEALWSLVKLESCDPVNVSSAFNNASEAFPRSAKVAYWRGRCGAYAADGSLALKEVSNILGSLTASESENAKIADPSLEPKRIVAQSFAEMIGKRMKQRAEDQSLTSASEAFEISLLDAVTLDTALLAAWAGLLESRDMTIALTAADAWASEEPDNALPLYAKAVVLTRDRKSGDPINVEAIAALELGNLRPACRAPDEPWPRYFSLNFPATLPKEAADLQGKPVTPQMLRKFVERMFFQGNAFGGGDTISESAIRGLGSSILAHSHRSSRQEDERYLRAFAGVGVHLVQSNRFSYGVTAGSADRAINRLETIAIEQGDFENAEKFAGIRDYLLATRRKVSDQYHANETGADSARLDLEASKLMEGQKRTISIPQIRFHEETRSSLTLGDRIDNKTNMVVLDLFYSSDQDVFVCRTDQRPLSEELDSDELAKRGYATLEQSIDEVRVANRQNRRSLGIFLVVHNRYMSQDIADICFVSGYTGKRDPCIVAFTECENLEYFRDSLPQMGLRVAQILGTGDKLGGDDIKNISEKADLVVVPASRLFQDDGQVTTFVSSIELEFIATTSRPEQLKLIEGVNRIAGTAPIRLFSRREKGDGH